MHTHGVNALLMLMDVALSRYPYQLKHFPAPLSFIVSYLVFNRIYYAETGVAVYPSLDYRKNLPLALGMIAATLCVLLPGTHLILWRWEVGCFALSERWRRQGEEEEGEVKKGPVSAGTVELSAHAALARRWAGGSGEGAEGEEVGVQTPSTTGSGVSRNGDVDVEAGVGAAAAPTGA